MVPGGGAGDHPSTRQGITHLSRNSGDCSGHRSESTDRHQTGEARATGREGTLEVSPRQGHEIGDARRPRIRKGLSALTSIIAMPPSSSTSLTVNTNVAVGADLHLVAGASWWCFLRSTRQNGTCCFPVHTIISATLIFWILAGRPVCAPAGSLASRVGPWLLLCQSRWPLHPAKRRPRMGQNENLRIADDWR